MTFARRMNVARTLVRIRNVSKKKKVSRKLRRELHESRAEYVRAAFAEARGKERDTSLVCLEAS